MSTRNVDASKLIQAAAHAASQAYVPYSHFPVGAALLTEQGELFSGCNIENASYGLTICAERVALFSAVAAGHTCFAAVAVVAGKAPYPCGACRQVLAEFCAPNVPLHYATLDRLDELSSVTVGELLPYTFKLK